MFKRKLQLPPSGTETFFLWGPRQAGKTTLLREVYQDALWIDLLKTELYGKAFENWVFHELCADAAYRETFSQISYWRLTSGIEVDFIVNDMQLAIEAKAVKRISSDHLKGLRELARDQPQVGRRILVCLESAPRQTEDGILILPALEFCRRLTSGELY